MKFSLFEYLYYAIPKSYENSMEKKYFDKYSNVLSVADSTRPYLDADSGFALIQADVVIQALRNKEKIESFADFFRVAGNVSAVGLEAAHKDLPHFAWKQKEIYVPIFASGLNTRYDKEIVQLAKRPLKGLRAPNGIDVFFVNPFSTYGTALYDSTFTRLMRIMSYERETVFYSYSFDTIYSVSDQGTLECQIPLFDRDLEMPDRSDLPVRVKKLMESYFAFDRPAFIAKLQSLGFISAELYDNIERLSLKDGRKHQPKADLI